MKHHPGSTRRAVLQRAGTIVAAFLVLPAALLSLSIPAATSPASASTTSWSASDLPGFPPYTADPGMQLEATACVSGSTSCAMVGTDLNMDGSTELVALTETNGGSWAAVDFPLPTNAANDVQLTELTCSTISSCVAVGFYQDAYDNVWGLIVTESGGSWSSIDAPLPANASAGIGPGVEPIQDIALEGVSCPSAGTCEAVGDYFPASGFGELPLIETLASGTWTGEQATFPAGATTDVGYLQTVACPSTGSCEALGKDLSLSGGSSSEALVETLSAGSWTPSEFSGFLAVAVSCPAVGSCVAVGQNDSTGKIETLASGSWTPTTPPTTAGTATALDGVACSAVGTCAAIGAGTSAYLFRMASGSWSETALPLAAGDTGGSVLFSGYPVDFSCQGSTCAAIGSYDTNPDGSAGVLFTNAAGSWTANDEPATAPGLPEEYGGMACSTSFCLYGDSSTDASGDNQGLIGVASTGGWSFSEAPTPADAGALPFTNVNSIACVPGGSCQAVGADASYGEFETALTASGSGGSWSQGAAPLPGDASTSVPSSELDDVSCATTGSCVAVGSYSGTSGDALIDAGGGASWAPESGPIGSLEAVSCPNATTCLATGNEPHEGGLDDIQGTIYVSSSGSWSGPISYSGGSVIPADLDALACSSLGTCVAAGSSPFADQSAGYLVYLPDLSSNDPNLVSSSAPLPANAAADADVDISEAACPYADECAVFGTYFDTSGHLEGVIWSESGGTWTTIELPLPSNAIANPDVTLGTASCSATGYCAVVGSYVDSSGNTQGLIVTGLLDAWSAIEAPLPNDAGATPKVDLGAVDCLTSQACVAVGSYDDNAGDTVPLMLGESSGAWQASSAPLPTGAAADPLVTLDTVSCSSVGECVAGGSYQTSNGVLDGLIEAVPALSITTSLLPNGTQGTPYSATLSATGGSGQPSWSLESGALPSGLTLSADGILSGTPTAEGTFLFTAHASDSGVPAQTTQASLSLSISGAALPTTTTPPLATVTPRTKTLVSSGKEIPVAITCRDDSCSGKAEIIRKVVVKEKKGKKTVKVTKTEVLASGKFSVKIDKSKTIDLKLSALGRTTFAHVKSHPIREQLEFVISGHARAFTVTIK